MSARPVTIKIGEMELRLAWPRLSVADRDDVDRLSDPEEWDKRPGEMLDLAERLLLKCAQVHHPTLTLEQLDDAFLPTDVPKLWRALDRLVTDRLEARAAIALKEAPWPMN